MKLNRLFIYPVLAVASLGFAGCEDVLDQQPLDSFTDDAVWGDLKLANLYLNDQYGKLVAETEKGVLFACLTDEVYQKHDYWQTNYTQGRMNPDTPSFGWDNTTYDAWYDYYDYIAKINLFLEKIDGVPGDETYRNTLKGQALFLRAWNYHMLYGLFGKVVIVDHTYSLDHVFGDEKRAEMDDVADFIVKDLDDAAKLLHDAQYDEGDLGRATEGAALALKSRVLLWKASPLFGTPSREKWQAAADAAKAVFDLNKYYLKQVTNSDEYAALFFDPTNPEVIFEKLYDPKFNTADNVSYLHQAPAGAANGYQGWGTWGPTHEVASQFQNSKGEKVEIVSGTTENPWKDREIRFGADLLVDGDMWGYGKDNQELELFVDGGGGRVGKHSNQNYDSEWWNVTATGYYMKKFLDPKYDMTGTLMHTTPWFFIRLAEIYLNYAECQIELENNTEALKYINLVRERALLPPATGADIRAEYEYERQCELLFEGQRFFDIRRWEKLQEVYSRPMAYVRVLYLGDDENGNKIKQYNIETEDWVWDEAQEEWVRKALLTPRFYKDESQYWLPIPRWELNKIKLDPWPYS